MEPVSDDDRHRGRIGVGIVQLTAMLPGAAMADGNRPVIEQVAAEYHRVMPVVKHADRGSRVTLGDALSRVYRNTAVWPP